ncbi:uncharacterized protein FTOL_08624 [Fusarium torulosum]|uniref:Uncharacterized protein n=1 Tax=Fusarium torulosum TaxID=33205 RepID=A0AAE8MEF7_9HYPO|nr:uncharacterized protein FTOL_08624 [Fusarium torulosum]
MADSDENDRQRPRTDRNGHRNNKRRNIIAALRSSRNRKTTSATRTAVGQAPDADQVPQLRDDPVRCDNCLSTTHYLDRCLKTTRGMISGCPLCKVAGHLLEDCEKFPLANTDPSTIVRLVVWDRGNMPAWETKVPWFKYLYFYMGTFDFFLQDRTFVQSAPLPWTETYAREVAASACSAQNNDDSGSTLSDPQTANLAAAWKTFANPHEYVWPFGPSTDPFRQAEA